MAKSGGQDTLGDPDLENSQRNFGVRDHHHWIQIEISSRFQVSRPRDLRSETISDIVYKLHENRDQPFRNSFQTNDFLMASLAKVPDGK